MSPHRPVSKAPSKAKSKAKSKAETKAKTKAKTKATAARKPGPDAGSKSGSKGKLPAKPKSPAKLKPVLKGAATKLALGAKAPSFSLPRDGGGTVSLGDFAGRKLVIYFYPRAETPGCTREAIDFSRHKEAFARAGADVVGVSADSVQAQDAFKAKHGLSIALASDEKRHMLEAYDVWQEKSLYGRKFMGIVRTTVLIDADGRIARIWPKVFVEGHAEEVLAAVKSL